VVSGGGPTSDDDDDDDPWKYLSGGKMKNFNGAWFCVP
jgi:hypothetical protein